MEDREIRAALDRPWAASDADDFEKEHRIYPDDAVLEYPQSGERIRGRQKIQAPRAAQPSWKPRRELRLPRAQKPLAHTGITRAAKGLTVVV